MLTTRSVLTAAREGEGGSGVQLESGLWGSWLATCSPAYSSLSPSWIRGFCSSQLHALPAAFLPALSPVAHSDLTVLDGEWGWQGVQPFLLPYFRGAQVYKREHTVQTWQKAKLQEPGRGGGDKCGD